MAEEERNRAESELRKHEAELNSAQKEHAAIRQKLLALEKKIIVGGSYMCIFYRRSRVETNFGKRRRLTTARSWTVCVAFETVFSLSRFLSTFPAGFDFAEFWRDFLKIKMEKVYSVSVFLKNN